MCSPKELIAEVAITDQTGKTSQLLKAQSEYPLIEISRTNTGLVLGGLHLAYPAFLSDVYEILNDINQELLKVELNDSSLQ